MKNGSAQARRLSVVAAALLLNSTLPNTAVAAEEALVQCGGVTGCHGSSDCKTAQHACKGHNGCMGQGFKNLTRAECERRGGLVSEAKVSNDTVKDSAAAEKAGAQGPNINTPAK